MTHPLIVRRDAAQATLDEFGGKRFAWGRTDCVRLAAWHLRRMGRRVSLVKGGAYSSERGARLALARAGFDSLEAAIEAQGLFRIPAAAALTGDLVALEGESSDGGFVWPSLTVALGNGRVLGFHAGREGVVEVRILRPHNPLMAWRVDPCPQP